MKLVDLNAEQKAANHDLKAVWLEKKRNELFSELRRDLSAQLLYLAPQLHFIGSSPKALAHFSGLPEDEVRAYVGRFLELGLWCENSEGYAPCEGISLSPSPAKVDEHLALTLALAGRLSDYGACWFESMVIPTTADLKKEFYREIYQCLRTFVAKSQKATPDTVVAWSHQGADCKSDGVI